MTVEGISPDGRKLIGWTAFPIPLATLAIILRFYVRFTTQGVRADDWCCLLALGLYCVQFACFAIEAIHGGVGWPQAEVSSPQLDIFLKSFWVAQFLYGLLSPAIKVSFLLLYRRIFPSRYCRLATLPVAALSVAWGIAVVFTVIFECVPVGSFWHLDQRTKCIDDTIFQQSTGIINVLLNCVILLFPLPNLWRLSPTLTRRMSLTAVFILGTFVVIASAVRVHAFSRVQPTDLTDTAVRPSLWTGLETGLGVLCNCLPTLPMLFRDTVEDMERKWWGGAGRREVMGWTFERRERVDSGLDLPLGEKGPDGETIEVGSQVDVRNMPIRDGITVRYEYSVSRV